LYLKQQNISNLTFETHENWGVSKEVKERKKKEAIITTENRMITKANHFRPRLRCPSLICSNFKSGITYVGWPTLS